MKYYLIRVWGGVETSLCGPYASAELRDDEALLVHERMGEDDSVHALDISADGVPTMGDYSGAFFTTHEETF